jgi:PilZ domain-containing protein
MAARPFGRAQRRQEDEAVPAPVVRRMYSDLRKSWRKRTLLAGVLSYGPGISTVDCKIMDVSETGARVQVEPGSILPADVFLVHLRDYTAYDAKVVWRRGKGNLGLQFNARHDLRLEPTDELRAAMRTYCVEHSLRTVPAHPGAGPGRPAPY